MRGNANVQKSFESNHNKPKSKPNATKNTKHRFLVSELKCYNCVEGHTVFNCKEFLDLAQSEGLKKVKD